MFLHNFKYSFLFLLKNKSLVFWTFFFPIILGTFFYMTFSNIENNEKLKKINIAIINNEELKNDKLLLSVLGYLSEDNNNEIFSTIYTDLEKAKELLENKEIIGYLEIKNSKYLITIKENGIEQTIFKYIIDEIIETKIIIKDISSTEKNINLEELYNKINNNITKVVDMSSDNLSYTMIEYYTLIAMSCLYGGIFGMYAINNILANMSKQGARVAISSIKKRTLLLSSLLAAFLIQLIGSLLLLSYTIFILNVDYGNNIVNTLIMTVTGSIAGLTLGVAIAALFKTNENIKIGIMLSITMLGSFLSGMMGITMKYIVDKNMPLLNIINPANMITDGFYSIYYYQSMDRFYFNIISLLIFSSIMVMISIVRLRSQKYDSI